MLGCREAFTSAFVHYSHHLISRFVTRRNQGAREAFTSAFVHYRALYLPQTLFLPALRPLPTPRTPAPPRAECGRRVGRVGVSYGPRWLDQDPGEPTGPRWEFQPPSAVAFIVCVAWHVEGHARLASRTDMVQSIAGRQHELPRPCRAVLTLCSSITLAIRRDEGDVADQAATLSGLWHAVQLDKL